MLDKELLSYIKTRKIYLFYIVLSNILGLLANVAITFFLIFLVKDLIEAKFNEAILKVFITLSALALKVIFTKLSSFLSTKLANYVVYKLRSDTYQKFIKLQGKTPFSVQEMSQLSTEGIEQLRLYYSNYIPSFFYSMIAPLILFTIFVFIDFKVALIYLASVPLIPISIILVSKWAKRIFNKYWDIYISLGDSFLDNTFGMKELKIFQYDEIRENKMKEESEEFRKITMKVLTMQLASITIMDLVAYGGAALGIIISLISLNNGLSIYLTLFMILLGAEFYLPLRALGSSFHVAMNGATAGKKVLKLLNESDYQDGNLEISKIDSLEFKNVDFSYLDALNLKDVSLKMSIGFNSICGVSGSGKSTIAKLSSKLLKVNNGEILVNNLNVDDIKSESLFKRCCYISNNSYLFHRSIKDSFLFYNPDLKESEMINLLKEVCLNNLSLDLVINDTTSNISGGEKQRLILAFYLSRDYDFYIFDEATSNIDIESEDIILNKIHELAKTKIVLFISHRINSIKNSDVIYFIENGEIKANGKFKDLLKSSEEFNKLCLTQESLESGIKYEKA